MVTDTTSVSSRQNFELQTSFDQEEGAPKPLLDSERDECLTRSGEAFDLDLGTPSATIQDVGQLNLTSTGSILPSVEQYLRLVCPLFPIICDQVLWETASTVAATGFKKDLSSCMTSFAMLLAKAYSPSSIEICDLSLFTEARQLLSSLPVKLTLEYAQTQILCSLFLLKRHQLLDSWQWLHAGCTTLYAMVRW